MEAPLSVHEFLKRYHLPQLVRIHCASQDQAAQQNCNEHRQLASNSSKHFGKNVAKPHEKSDWTYRAGSGGSVRASSRSQLELNRMAELSDGEDEELGGGFRSLFISPSQDQFRVPRASLAAPKLQQDEATKLTGQNHSSNQQQELVGQTASQMVGNRIKLAPTIRWPAMAKLQLEQPFLLYKAFKKIELCAYVIDASNELCEKSGDPIYFPHNYTGWFSLPSQSQAPLDSVELVCRQGAQLFMTRDQIAGYQLPSKLSSLTKLSNDQLLALPLAINLERARGANCDQEGAAGQLSDIRQIVIGAGQVLKVCGVYEDVLPLMESNKSQASVAFVEPGAWLQSAGQMYEYQLQDKLYEQMIYRQQVEALSRQQSTGAGKKLLRLRPQQWGLGRSSVVVGEQQSPYGEKHVIYGQPSVQQVAKGKSKVRTSSSKKQQASEGTLTAPSRRYARCIVLSQRSVDRLTEAKTNGEQVAAAATTDDTRQEPEAEVLIPLDQRGRFYLCATNQSLLSELYSCGCHQAAVVYRLSQIVSLVSLSRQLAAKTCNQQQQQQLRPSRLETKVKYTCDKQPARRLALPLQLQLVVGPRPCNFSPSMFGSSSTVNSYFRCEANVGGHALRCQLNKNQREAGGEAAGGCQCAEELQWATGEAPAGRLGLFSARLLVERIAKRDVLLACTIKPEPLLRLDPFGSEGQPGAGGCPQRQRAALLAIQSACSRLTSKHSTIGGPASRLAALASEPARQQEDKSTFGRLKACRSLISLNGRRRRRPKLAAMFSAGGQLDSAPPGGASRAEPANWQQWEQADPGNQIVMVEFDCTKPSGELDDHDDEAQQVRFSRTFVESSIPSSSIPELVLKRMEHCGRHSVGWERQLKLSYASLSRDFDACRRQMALGARRHLSPGLERRQTAPDSTANSTASSRSSSGVSSAAGAHEKRPEPSSPSRLSRLVQRILPAGQAQRQLVLAELQQSLEKGTLMNAQKVHRKLTSECSSGSGDERAAGRRRRASLSSVSSARSSSAASSHLYESLERLQSQRRPAAEDCEAQWWRRSTELDKKRPSTSGGWLGRQLRPPAGCATSEQKAAARRPSGWRDAAQHEGHLDEFGMEPVSIEAFTEFGSATLLDEAPAGARSRPAGRPPPPEPPERDYANLPAPRGRMERKLARLRARQRAQAGRPPPGPAPLGWRSELELAAADQLWSLDGSGSSGGGGGCSPWRPGYSLKLAPAGAERRRAARSASSMSAAARPAAQRWSSASSVSSAAELGVASSSSSSSSSSSAAGSWRALSPARRWPTQLQRAAVGQATAAAESELGRLATLDRP